MLGYATYPRDCGRIVRSDPGDGDVAGIALTQIVVGAG